MEDVRNKGKYKILVVKGLKLCYMLYKSNYSIAND